MLEIESFVPALVVCLISIICWGSWINTMKFGNTRVELHYYDFSFSVFGFSLLVGVIIGGGLLDNTNIEKNFPACLKSLDNSRVVYALCAGVFFNCSNILLSMAVRLIGLTLSFFISTGISILLSSVISFATNTSGDPAFLFSGLGVVLISVIFSGLVFKFSHSEQSEVTTIADTVVDNPKMYQPEVSSFKTFFICVLSGIFQSIWYSLLNFSVVPNDNSALSAFTALFFVGLSILITTFPLCYYFAKKPIIGGPFSPSQEYCIGGPKWHLQAAGGGCIWALGTLLYLMGYLQPELRTGYHIGQMYPVVGLIWGLLLWKEFQKPSMMVLILIILMVIFYYGGISLIIMSQR